MDEGSDFAYSFALKNEDGTVFSLVGYSAKSSFKKVYSDLDSIADFICTIDEVNGIVTISLSHGITENLPFERPDSS